MNNLPESSSNELLRLPTGADLVRQVESGLGLVRDVLNESNQSFWEEKVKSCSEEGRDLDEDEIVGYFSVWINLPSLIYYLTRLLLVNDEIAWAYHLRGLAKLYISCGQSEIQYDSLPDMHEMGQSGQKIIGDVAEDFNKSIMISPTDEYYENRAGFFCATEQFASALQDYFELIRRIEFNTKQDQRHCDKYRILFKHTEGSANTEESEENKSYFHTYTLPSLKERYYTECAKIHIQLGDQTAYEATVHNIQKLREEAQSQHGDLPF